MPYLVTKLHHAFSKIPPALVHISAVWKEEKTQVPNWESMVSTSRLVCMCPGNLAITKGEARGREMCISPRFGFVLLVVFVPHYSHLVFVLCFSSPEILRPSFLHFFLVLSFLFYQASMTTLRTKLPSSSIVLLASSNACLAAPRPLNRCVTMSSRLGRL